MSKAKCLAVFGAGSDAGKSVTAAALCRILSDSGISTAPFKSQNMSNNSCVTPDGGEIGRAQGVQAECARVAPSVHMNPLLLKPQGGNSCQKVLLGKVAGNSPASEFKKDKAELFATLMESLDLLRSEHDAVIIEGAGSCAEVNLRPYDIANFRVALAAGAPVLLVADISRGGIFAQLIGTVELLTPEERKLVKGFIVNNFKGDVALFADGARFIEERTGVPVLGVVPHFSHIQIDAEDSVMLDSMLDPPSLAAEGKITVAVLRYPCISNFTDMAALMREPSVNLCYLTRPRPLKGVDLLILPGSKNTRSDLQWLRQKGWDREITDYAKTGGHITGICGGYQMLGKMVDDPHGVEGEPGCQPGLGLLPVRTVLSKEKRLTNVTAKWRGGGQRISGYEIHMGMTEPEAGTEQPIAIDDGNGSHPDGAISADGRVLGTYLHGLFDEPDFRKQHLTSIKGMMPASDGRSPAAFRQAQYDLLAEHFRDHLNIPRILAIAGLEAHHG